MYSPKFLPSCKTSFLLIYVNSVTITIMILLMEKLNSDKEKNLLSF